MGKDCACLSVVLGLECIAVCVGVRILPYGQGCACLSVVLVLGCIAVRVCVRIRPYGQGLSLSLHGFGALVHCPARWCTNTAYGQGLRLSLVVLVLSSSCAHWCADRAYGHGLLLFLRGPGAQRELRALVYGYGLWARIALSVRGPGAQRELRALVLGYGLWARIARVSPWSWCSARVARIGVRIRPIGKDCACFSVSWCSCVQCWTSSAFRSGA